MPKNKKKKWDGILFPPAVGYKFKTLLFLYKKNRIDPKYYWRMIMLGLLNLINAPFRIYEQAFINPKIQKEKLKTPPVFILGHWRSGTTHLHNLLCSVPKAAFINTYQSVFPDTLFTKAGNLVFQKMMQLLIPSTRRGDNVKLHADYPQEEGFILGNAIPMALYYFWYFPQNAHFFYEQAINFNVKDEKKTAWFENYDLIIKKAVRNTKGDYFVSKNPPNTGRMLELYKNFPKAKFIHIHRNPIEVFLSTKHFFSTVLPSLQLQKFSENEVEELVFSFFKKIMKKYLDERNQIPKENLIEVSFADLEQRPLEVLEKIYSQLGLPDFDTAKPHFEQHLESKKGYKKNVYKIKRSLLNRILKEWDFAMSEWAYDLPENLEIID